MKFFAFKRNDEGEDDGIEGERTAAPTGNGIAIQNRLTHWALMGGAAVLVVVMLGKYYARATEAHAQQAAPAKDPTRTLSTSLPPLTPPPPDPAPAPAPAAAANATQLPPLTQDPAPATAGASAAPKLTPAQQLLERRLSSPIAFNLGGTGDQVARAAAGAVATAGGTGSGTGNGPADPLSKTLQPARFNGARAYMLPDPRMTITQGTLIPCTVRDALDTTLPGIVTCIQQEDVYSADHTVLLLERGTKWVGQQGTGISQGQKRVGIVWARGETPNHVLVDVDSGGADALGRPGIPGTVDTHFWDRFGAAILLSLVSDIGPYLTATKQGGGNNNTTIAFPSITAGAQSVMSDVLKSTLNIQPTLTAPQGAEIAIYVARDLDFSDVYALRVTK